MLATVVATSFKTASLHSGTTEVAGPRYFRQPIDWVVSGHVARTAEDLEFEVPAGTYDTIGCWDANGNFCGYRETTEQRFVRPGTYVIAAGEWVEVVE